MLPPLPRAVVVVPTYNERESLPLLVESIHRHAPSLDILIVDDNSPDGTGQLADELSRAAGGRLVVLHRGKKEGLGRAYVAGFNRALELGYEIILQMDADLSHDPSYLPVFLDRIRECDLVLGSRYLQGICVVNWDFKRLLLSKLATRYVRAVTGMKFTDATGGFKAWRTSALRTIGLDRVFSNGYLFQIELTYRAYRAGLRIGEIPIIFYERNLGRSKMDWRIIWEALVGVVRIRLRD
jgi:dolichol-phosphate mannosyltransferase